MVFRCRALLLVILLSGCASSPPGNLDDLCAIFDEKEDWYEEAADARERWGSPIPVMMAIMHQESRFRAKAKPPRRMILGFIPGPRPSDAYGYSQAKSSTWSWYERTSGRSGDRDDFGDAIDFIGWYNGISQQRNGIAAHDTYRLYLAYHEGHGGFARGSFQSKGWLQGVARKVSSRSQRYAAQLKGCEERLQDNGWFFGWF